MNQWKRNRSRERESRNAKRNATVAEAVATRLRFLRLGAPEEWKRQKDNFVQEFHFPETFPGKTKRMRSDSIDRAFAFHLLRVHAKYCPSCKKNNADGDDRLDRDGHENETDDDSDTDDDVDDDITSDADTSDSANASESDTSTSRSTESTSKGSRSRSKLLKTDNNHASSNHGNKTSKKTSISITRADDITISNNGISNVVVDACRPSTLRLHDHQGQSMRPLHRPHVNDHEPLQNENRISLPLAAKVRCTGGKLEKPAVLLDLETMKDWPHARSPTQGQATRNPIQMTLAVPRSTSQTAHPVDLTTESSQTITMVSTLEIGRKYQTVNSGLSSSVLSTSSHMLMPAEAKYVEALVRQQQQVQPDRSISTLKSNLPQPMQSQQTQRQRHQSQPENLPIPSQPQASIDKSMECSNLPNLQPLQNFLPDKYGRMASYTPDPPVFGPLPKELLLADHTYSRISRVRNEAIDLHVQVDHTYSNVSLDCPMESDQTSDSDLSTDSATSSIYLHFESDVGSTKQIADVSVSSNTLRKDIDISASSNTSGKDIDVSASSNTSQTDIDVNMSSNTLRKDIVVNTSSYTSWKDIMVNAYVNTLGKEIVVNNSSNTCERDIDVSASSNTSGKDIDVNMSSNTSRKDIDVSASSNTSQKDIDVNMSLNTLGKDIEVSTSSNTLEKDVDVNTFLNTLGQDIEVNTSSNTSGEDIEDFEVNTSSNISGNDGLHNVQLDSWFLSEEGTLEDVILEEDGFFEGDLFIEYDDKQSEAEKNCSS